MGTGGGKSQGNPSSVYGTLTIYMHSYISKTNISRGVASKGLSGLESLLCLPTVGWVQHYLHV